MRGGRENEGKMEEKMRRRWECWDDEQLGLEEGTRRKEGLRGGEGGEGGEGGKVREDRERE